MQECVSASALHSPALPAPDDTTQNHLHLHTGYSATKINAGIQLHREIMGAAGILWELLSWVKFSNSSQFYRASIFRYNTCQVIPNHKTQVV